MAGALRKADGLVEWLNAKPVLSGEVVEKLARSFQRSLAVNWIGLYKAGLSFEEAVEQGRTDLVPEAVQWAAKQGGSVTRGELVDMHPDMPPLPDENYGKGRDQDLEFQCDYVRASFERYWMAGEPVPPFFVERIAVLLRRIGERERELKVLRAWYRHVGERPTGARHAKLIERLEKLEERRAIKVRPAEPPSPYPA